MKKLDRKGFTLIELMVVMAIIAILAVLIVGAIQMARKTATETTHRANTKTIQTALEGNFTKYKAYCGNSGNPMECTTQSFVSAAGSDNLDAKMSTASTKGACATGGAAEGGGVIAAIDANGYTLAVVNESCTAVMDGDTLTFP